jgi:HD-GYP domain-containing protein (c-di-GMP phosphodiesterase class II)
VPESRPHAFDPLSEQLLAEARERATRILSPSERRTYWTSSALFVAVAIALLVAAPRTPLPETWVVGLLVVSYALASRLEFEVGSTLAIATQLVFVEMMFLLPPEQLPLWVAAGSLLGQLPEYMLGIVPLERMLVVVGSSWFAFGPALVLMLVPVHPALDAQTLTILALALASQFAVDLVSSTVREWAALRVPPRQVVSQLSLVFAIDLALAPLGLLAALGAAHDAKALLLPLPLLFLVGLSMRERERRLDQALELSNAYRGTAVLLGDVVEADDAYTGAHSRDVLELVLAVCDELELDAKSRLDAEFTALLHDVGKIRVPAAILNKPGPLSPDERAIVNLHSITGQRLLQHVGGRLGEVGDIVRSCHERWDGDGYPDGLAGEEIPLVARVVACCDAFSAMTTDRSYRRAMSMRAALQELEACAGTHFDPKIVAVLTELLRTSRAGVERAPQLVAVAAVPSATGS